MIENNKDFKGIQQQLSLNSLKRRLYKTRRLNDFDIIKTDHPSKKVRNKSGYDEADEPSLAR